MIEFNYLKLIETYRSNECVNEQEVKFKSDQIGSHKYQTAKNTKYIFLKIVIAICVITLTSAS